MIVCPKCGKENIDISNFCRYCGSRMNHNSYRTTGRNPNPFGNEDIEYLIERLGSFSSHERNRAVAELVDIGERAFVAILKASYCDNSTIRRKICDFFGNYRDPRGVIPLIRLLSDPNHGVRRRAANALIHIGDERAVMPLIKALNDSEHKVQERSIEALGNIGDERAVPVLEKLLDDNSLYYEAMKSLKKMGHAGEKAINRHRKQVEEEKGRKIEEEKRRKEEERLAKEAEKERIKKEERYKREMEKIRKKAAGKKLRMDYEKSRRTNHEVNYVNSVEERILKETEEKYSNNLNTSKAITEKEFITVFFDIGIETRKFLDEEMISGKIESYCLSSPKERLNYYYNHITILENIRRVLKDLTPPEIFKGIYFYLSLEVEYLNEAFFYLIGCTSKEILPIRYETLFDFHCYFIQRACEMASYMSDDINEMNNYLDSYFLK